MNAMPVRWTPRSSSEVMLYSHDSLLATYAESNDISLHEARHHLAGLKQFLFICAATPGTHAPSSVVATLWQSFLLSTRDYREFCHGYFGRFIDHRTREAPSPETYLATREAAEGVFGKLDEALWPADGGCASHDDSGRDG